MIRGAHVVLYSKDAEADRAFFRDVLGFRNVDAGHGWLIFALPPAELAMHPAEHNDRAELYLMCDDVKAEIAELVKKDVVFEEPHTERWGTVASIRLPGGGKSWGSINPRIRWRYRVGRNCPERRSARFVLGEVRLAGVA